MDLTSDTPRIGGSASSVSHTTRWLYMDVQHTCYYWALSEMRLRAIGVHHRRFIGGVIGVVRQTTSDFALGSVPISVLFLLIGTQRPRLIKTQHRAPSSFAGRGVLGRFTNPARFALILLGSSRARWPPLHFHGAIAAATKSAIAWNDGLPGSACAPPCSRTRERRGPSPLPAPNLVEPTATWTTRAGRDLTTAPSNRRTRQPTRRRRRRRRTNHAASSRLRSAETSGSRRPKPWRAVSGLGRPKPLRVATAVRPRRAGR